MIQTGEPNKKCKKECEYKINTYQLTIPSGCAIIKSRMKQCNLNDGGKDMATVLKRGSSYQIIVSMGVDASGKQIRKTTTFKPPSGIAEAKAKKMAEDYAAVWEDKISGYLNLDESQTLKELIDWYYDTVAPNKLCAQSAYQRRADMYRYIIPRIGNKRLKDITPVLLDMVFSNMNCAESKRKRYILADKKAFDGIKAPCTLSKSLGLRQDTIGDLLKGRSVEIKSAQILADYLKRPLNKVFTETAREANKEKLSPSTIQKVFRGLKAIFESACKKEIIRRNPCNAVTLPRVEKEVPTVLDKNQCLELLDYVDAHCDEQTRMMIWLFLATGMRRGELCGLTWDNIDFENNRIHIKKSLSYVIDHYVLGPPKTRGSVRNLAISPLITEMLAQHKEWQTSQRLLAGPVYTDNGLVFANKKGGYINPGDQSNKIKKVMLACGFSEAHVHTLRHATASLLINDNVPATIVAAILGHSSTNTTLSVYAHAFADVKEAAMQMLDDVLFQEAVKQHSKAPLSKPIQSEEPLSKPLQSQESLSKPIQSEESLSKPLQSEEPLSKPIQSEEPLSMHLQPNDTSSKWHYQGVSHNKWKKVLVTSNFMP
jgi:integrase